MAALLVTLSAMVALVRELSMLARQPKYRASILWLFVLLLAGMVFYHFVEGWSWLDALYFCVITLATVGYGDLAPTTPEAKIFTMVYLFLGISIFVSVVSMLVKERQEIRAERMTKAHEEVDSSP